MGVGDVRAPRFPDVSRSLRPLAALAILLACLGAVQGRAQTRPLEFTPQERAQFEDGTQRTKRLALPQVALGTSVAGWIDSTRIIYSTREIAGVWKAQPGEPAKVVVFHLSTGAVEETPYRGNLICFTPERMIVGAPASPHAGGFNAARERLLAGRFGDALEPVADIAAREVLRYSCELNPIVAAGAANAGTTRVPLLPGHGFLRLPRGQEMVRDAGAVPGYEILDPGGRPMRRLTGAGFPLQWQITYLPWAAAYFTDKGAFFPSQMFWPNGESRIVPAPPLLAALGPGVGSGQAVATRAGTLWNFVPWHAFWKMQGLYLLTQAGTLLRVDDAFVPAMPGVTGSADGCQAFYFRRAGDPNNAREPFVPTVMNVCEGGKRE